MSDSLRPHESQHARPPCPSPTHRVYSNPCPSSQWCHPVISSSVVPFSSCPQSRPESGYFSMSQLFAWGGQSFSFSISPSDEHPGLIFRMDWSELLAVQGTLKSLLQHHNSKASIFFGAQLKSKKLSFIIISFMARGNSALCMRDSLKIEHGVLTSSINRNLEISPIRGRNHFPLSLAWNS